MFGHSPKDLVDMQIAIEEAVFYLPPSNHDKTREDLNKAYDLLQSLIVLAMEDKVNNVGV